MDDTSMEVRLLVEAWDKIEELKREVARLNQHIEELEDDRHAMVYCEELD